MGQVRQSRGLLKPASGNIKSEPDIIAGIAEAFFEGRHAVPWKELAADYDRIREKIDLVARGFSDTGKRSKGKGYYLPNNAREADFSGLPNGRAQITCNRLPEHPMKEGELLLMTIRSHDQFNTTIYGLDDRYRGIFKERRVVLLHPEDMKARNIEKEEQVELTSRYNGKLRSAGLFLAVPYKIPRGNAAAYFPETNLLVPYHQFADRSGTPISKSIRIRVEKVDGEKFKVQSLIFAVSSKELTQSDGPIITRKNPDAVQGFRFNVQGCQLSIILSRATLNLPHTPFYGVRKYFSSRNPSTITLNLLNLLNHLNLQIQAWSGSGRQVGSMQFSIGSAFPTESGTTMQYDFVIILPPSFSGKDIGRVAISKSPPFFKEGQDRSSVHQQRNFVRSLI